MLYAITGKPGSGKSYFLAYKFVELVKANPDIMIFSNVPMEYDGYKAIYFYDINDLLTIFFAPELVDFPRVVLLDEAYYLLDAKNWKTLAPEMTIALRQHRKLQVDMYVVSQDWNNLNVDFRRLVNSVYYARKAMPWLSFLANKILPLFYRQNFSTWFFTRYELYREVSETQQIPFVKNGDMNASFREGKFIMQSPDRVSPSDTQVIGQTQEIRNIFNTMYQVAKPDKLRLNAILDSSTLYKKIVAMLQ